MTRYQEFCQITDTEPAPIAGQLITMCRFAAKSLKDGSFSMDTYKTISQERYSVYLVLSVHVVLRLLMSLCAFSMRGMLIAVVCYGISDTLNFLLERRVNRTLRPHEDALLDFATSMLVREAFRDERVLFVSVRSGLETFALNGGLRLWTYFHRDKGSKAKGSLA